MEEKFTFDVTESLNAIKNFLDVAEQYKDSNNFIGNLATRLLELKSLIYTESYINNLNNNLITCKNFEGIKLENAWRGSGKFTEKEDVLRLHRLALFLVIYIRELSFRGNFELNPANSFYFLYEFVRNNRDEFIEHSKWCLDLFDDLPTLIMQEEFHSEHALALSKVMSSTDISKVENFINTREETISKIDTWNSEFNDKEQSVNRLKEKLDEYETAFNFVGLYQGFSQLKGRKDRELSNANIQYYILMCLMIIIPIIELLVVVFAYDGDAKYSNKLLVLAIPSISLVLILIWLFRIILQNIKSIKSQILQLELRMTLCQFIQSYAEKSKELKEHNKEGFEKFESLIFSSIVTSDDKIPNTLDGIESLTSLIKVVQKP